ncbi:uncharacterized protein F5147DRAFT_652007 [Suillus discolor]|uniref:Uncharacterized protein n=1 Tax=Suillus discolor TaxID=1912936 RepID=A0A9P7F9R2_9AGAM|nr:uncharacterized protein F5147DRAFT_652007 [Suillus discolor]KAG2110398.1 hypothetical protein F5147DRAFT_652007 [Suillus discolor]
MSTRRVTRAKNATQHPGIPDITPKKKHRTAEEVAAELQSKLDAKEEKERTKRAGIKRVAKYEKKQADQDVVTDATPKCVHTVQRVADSYRSFIGSAAIAIIIAYLESQETLKHSDDNRVEFATYTLDKLRFLYKKANSDNKSKFRRLYQGAFVVQTFGAHFTAINGARKIHGLEKPGENLNPVGGLALSCAAVERALTLIATRTITIEMVLTAKGKSIPLPKTLNHSTGKVSNRQTGFNDVTWGSSTRSYEFSKKSHRSGNDRAVDDAVDDEDLDECAQLMDISESESGSEDSDHTIGSDAE